MPPRLRVIFFGRSQPYALSVLEQLAPHHQIVGVVDSPGRSEGPSKARALADRLRGRPSLARAASKLGVPCFTLTRARLADLDGFVSQVAPDVGVICSLATLLPAPIIERVPRGILNLHPSLLPNYRGPSPTFWEFWHREPEGGVTIHFIDSGEDTGDIVGQARVAIPFGTDGAEHFRRCHDQGARLLREALDGLAAGQLERRPQRHLPCPFRARYVNSTEAPLEWRATPIEQVFHLLRGMLPFMDLLPPRPVHLAPFTFRATSFERCVPCRPPARFFARGARIGIAHAEGHVFLQARPAPLQAVRWLREFRQRRN